MEVDISKLSPETQAIVEAELEEQRKNNKEFKVTKMGNAFRTVLLEQVTIDKVLEEMKKNDPSLELTKTNFESIERQFMAARRVLGDLAPLRSYVDGWYETMIGAAIKNGPNTLKPLRKKKKAEPAEEQKTLFANNG